MNQESIGRSRDKGRQGIMVNWQKAWTVKQHLKAENKEPSERKTGPCNFFLRVEYNEISLVNHMTIQPRKALVGSSKTTNEGSKRTGVLFLGCTNVSMSQCINSMQEAQHTLGVEHLTLSREAIRFGNQAVDFLPYRRLASNSRREISKRTSL